MDSYDMDRIAQLEIKVDFLFRRLGVDPSMAFAGTDGGEFPPVLYDLIAKGRLIDAIKVYRELTGVSLKQAKQAVEALAGRSS